MVGGPFVPVAWSFTVPFVLIHVTVGFTMAAVFGIRLPRGGR